MAYNTSLKLKDYHEFFTLHLINEQDITKANSNSKTAEHILDSIRYEYLTKEPQNTKGLFSIDKIMAFVYCFDYNDDNSLRDMFEINSNITTAELLKIRNNDDFATVKCFICCKFPYLIEEVPEDCVYSELIEEYMKLDPRVTSIIDRIQAHLDSNRDRNDGVMSKRRRANEVVFFTSSKSNMGISYCFDSIINLIKQKDELWKKIAYEDINSGKEEGSNYVEDDDDEGTGIFCCKSKKVIDEKALEDKENRSMINQTHNEEPNLKFRDDEDESGYDMNIVIKQKDEDEETKKDEKSGCVII